MGRTARSRWGRSSRRAPARPPDPRARERAAMNTTISPQIRILAVVGLLAAVGLGASLLVFGHGSSKTAGQAAATRATPRSSTPARAGRPRRAARARAARPPPPHTPPAEDPPRVEKHTAKTHVASRTQATKT